MSDGIVASSTGASLTCPYFTASIARSTSSIDGPSTIRPASRSASPPWNAGSPDNARFTRAVAPGWRMLPVRHTIVGPSVTGSQRAAVRLGSAAETISGALSSVPSARVTPIARVPRFRICDHLGAGSHLDAERGGGLRQRVG